MDAKFDFSTLAHISEGYSSGTIDQVSRAQANAVFKQSPQQAHAAAKLYELHGCIFTVFTRLDTSPDHDLQQLANFMPELAVCFEEGATCTARSSDSLACHTVSALHSLGSPQCIGFFLVCLHFQVVCSMITPRRLSRMGSAKLSMAEALQWLCRAEPTSKDLLEALQAWTAKTPAHAALTQASPASCNLFVIPACSAELDVSKVTCAVQN